MAKQRIDQLLVEKGLIESREKAKRMILAAKVRVNDQVVSKPGQQVNIEADVVLESPPPFVSRGGEKLVASMNAWPIQLEGRVCADIGASTGGFTDCMLQHGASKVYAVDVGNGQLDWKLRQDERVIVMDKTNARYLTPKDLPEEPTFASVDVSFISLTKILPALVSILAPDAEIVTLIKPQFEAGREQVGRGGVVKSPEVHREVCERIEQFGTETLHLSFAGLIASPITGPAGNIEFLGYWKKGQ